MQRERFSEDFNDLSSSGNIKSKSKLRFLRPTWDPQDQLMRVLGRIELALRDRAQEAPILLPADHPVMDMLIMATHKRLHHAGVRTTVAELKERFWPVRCRQQVKRVLKKCVPCQRLQSRPFNEEPAPLPLSRTREAAPFEVTGVDFPGPLFVKPHTGSSGTENQGKQELEKMYICLFTCAVTRAVHLELVRDMTAHTFILALKRFFARRGISSIIYSDNAQTFHYTEKYLKSIQTNPTVNDWLANNRVEWRFSPGLAPWWGGFWERMVRSVKDLLRKSIGKKTMNFDQLQTELTEIEAVINDRPLTYVAEGVDEPYPLSPSLLLMGRRANTTPSKPAVTINKESSNQKALIDRSKQRSTLVHEWFKLWQKDYLNDLMRFHSKGKTGRKPQLGELVLIHDGNATRLT